MRQAAAYPARPASRHAVVPRLRERGMRLGVEPQQLAVVLEHLLVVRHAPVALRGVAEEPASDVVVHSARRHRAERLVQHARELIVPTPPVFVEDKAKQIRLWELRLTAEAAEFGIE